MTAVDGQGRAGQPRPADRAPREAPARRLPVPQPRAVVARLRRPRPVRGARRAQPAARAGQLPDDLRGHARRVLPDPDLRAAPAGRTPARPRRRPTAGPPPSSWPPPARASSSSSTELTTTYADAPRRARRRRHRDRQVRGDPGAPRGAPPAVPRRDLPGPDAARGRPGPPVPVHLDAQPVDRGRPARPRDRRDPLRPGQGPARSCRA